MYKLYAFPSHVKQVFSVDDPHDPSWKVVLHKGTRNTRVVGTDESAVLGVGVVDEARSFYMDAIRRTDKRIYDRGENRQLVTDEPAEFEK
jgi:hypothetical protein